MACKFHFDGKGNGCPKVSGVTVEILDVAYERMMNICKKVSDEYHTEVMFYLIAERDAPFRVVDIIIPEKQTLGGASVETADDDGNSLYEQYFKKLWSDDPDRVLIGTGHSHPTFGVGFSGTDDTDLKSRFHLCVNEGFPFIDIVVNNEREINCRVVMRTDCDDFVTVNDVTTTEIVPVGLGRQLPAAPLRGHLFGIDDEFEKLEEPAPTRYGGFKGARARQSSLYGYGNGRRYGYGYGDEPYYDDYFQGGQTRDILKGKKPKKKAVDKGDSGDFDFLLCAYCGQYMTDDEIDEAEECELCGELICESCAVLMRKKDRDALIMCRMCIDESNNGSKDFSFGNF